MMDQGSPDQRRPRIPDEEYQQRIEHVRTELHAQGLEVGLAYATEHMPGDVQYLSGYDPHLENAALLVLPGHVIALGGAEGNKMFVDGGRAGTWRNLTMFEIPFQDYGDTRFWTVPEVLLDTIGHVPDEIGLLSAANVITKGILDAIREGAGKAIRFRDVSSIMAQARYHKSVAELDMHRTASAIATEAMRALLANIEPGMRELELAAYADYEMKRLGAYGFGFDTMVCSGPRIDTIIGRATNRVIERGEMVLLGVSPRYEGYTSALGRAFVAGGASRAQADFLDHGIRAYELAAERLRFGRPARDVDLAARNYLESVGLGAYHAYGVGHGIGLTECLEERTATRTSDYDLPAGITMMLDVGIFGHPVHHGARHEDPFLIDHQGKTEILTDLPMRVYV